jgi:hypothetical protein
MTKDELTNLTRKIKAEVMCSFLNHSVTYDKVITPHQIDKTFLIGKNNPETKNENEVVVLVDNELCASVQFNGVRNGFDFWEIGEALAKTFDLAVFEQVNEGYNWYMQNKKDEHIAAKELKKFTWIRHYFIRPSTYHKFLNIGGTLPDTVIKTTHLPNGIQCLSFPNNAIGAVIEDMVVEITTKDDTTSITIKIPYGVGYLRPEYCNIIDF